MKPIFESRRWDLAIIGRSGKKKVTGRLVFVGRPSALDVSGRAVISPIRGLVLESRCEMSGKSRLHRLGPYVTVLTNDGIRVRFSNLETRAAREGALIDVGGFIGVSKPNGVVVDCMRNNSHNAHHIDALAYLNVPLGVWSFCEYDITDEERVVAFCGVDADMRDYINRRPGADEFWRSVAAKLREDAK